MYNMSYVDWLTVIVKRGSSMIMLIQNYCLHKMNLYIFSKCKSYIVLTKKKIVFKQYKL